MQAVLGSVHPLQLLKVFPSITDVDESGCRRWKKTRDVDFYYADFVFCFFRDVEERHLHYLRMEGSDMMTMTYVLEVKTSMKAAKLEFLTSMLWKEAASLLE